MAAKSAGNAKNLEALGAARLAELLLEISAGNAPGKRRLRLALAAAKSPGDAAKEIRKRLTAIARSRSFVDWQGVRSLADDLDTRRPAIVETVAKTDATEALDLLWRFMPLAFGNAAAKRRLRLALAAAKSPGDAVVFSCTAHVDLKLPAITWARIPFRQEGDRLTGLYTFTDHFKHQKTQSCFPAR